MAGTIKQESGYVDRKEQMLEAARNAIESASIPDRQACYILFDEDGNARLQVRSRDGEAKDKVRRGNNTAYEPSSRGAVDAGYFTEDDLETAAYSLRAKNQRMMKASYQRGRSRHRRNSSHYSIAPYPQPDLVADVTTPESDDEEPIPARRQMKSFQINETDKVVAFIASRLKRMQQLADKKIAKAWIKGICPKKQANFPYSNGKSKEHTGKKPDVPGWWPDQSVCRFLEPDHIKRDERMNLCLHLLRLRPDPAQLQAWNHGKSEPHPTHVKHGWTAFLTELAGLEIFDELPKEDKKRTIKKQELMEQMYAVAAMEERYQEGEIDGTDLYSWEEDQEDRKLPPTKRSRQSSVSSSTGRGSSLSTTINGSKTKKARKEEPSREPDQISAHAFDLDMLPNGSPNDAEEQHGLPSNMPMTFEDHNDDYKAGVNGFPYSEAEFTKPRPNEFFLGQHGPASAPQQQANMFGSVAEQPGWCKYEESPQSWMDQNTSVVNSPAGFSTPDAYQSQQPSPFFPAQHSYDLSHCSYPQQMVQTQQNGPVAEPCFQPLPTAAYPSGSMVPGVFIAHRTDIQHDRTHPGTMPASQYFAPADADPTVADFRPSTVPYQQCDGSQRLAERHLSTMGYHGLPFMQAAS